ncbi:hypothetical protein D3C71_1855710 [compost metagenome]
MNNYRTGWLFIAYRIHSTTCDKADSIRLLKSKEQLIRKKLFCLAKLALNKTLGAILILRANNI